MIGEKIEDLIRNKVKQILDNVKEEPEIVELVQTDNIGEVIEKLVILHIRTWMLEDKISASVEEREICDLKRKIDICFKQKRPKFVQAINLMIDDSIKNNKSLLEDSVKLYNNVKE
jgi:hypothetical protein